MYGPSSAAYKVELEIKPQIGWTSACNGRTEPQYHLLGCEPETRMKHRYTIAYKVIGAAR